MASIKKILYLVFVASPFCCGSIQAQEIVNKNEFQVVVETDQEIYKIHPDFWGTNFLYWIDDDAALADGKIVKRLKDVNMKVLRYPGGTVGDNFHWKTNTLENVNMFPYESGAAESDFDEFMRVCKQTGAEASCVLNTESWAVKKDIARGAHEAADWLRYCRSKGYKVKYWEIGNETYWHPVMSAEEYGDLVNIYADSLKKIDPDIILGINGHWDINFVGTKERIKKEAFDQLMKYRGGIDSRERYGTYQKFLEKNTILPVTTGDVKWWETLSRKCGANVDMIIVHWYFAPNQLPLVTKKLLEVRDLFSKTHPDKKYLLNISEYNVTQRSPESAMHLTEMLGALLHAKTDLTALWPMRLKYKKPTLLEFDSGKPSILYQIHQQLSVKLRGALVQTASSEKIPAYASKDGASVSIVMTGSKIKQPAPVIIKVNAGQKFTSCSVWRINGTEFDYQEKEEKLQVKQGSAVVDLRPGEVVIAVFK